MTSILTPSDAREERERSYNPEDFGLSRETVYEYRKRLVTQDGERQSTGVRESDGIFLYSRAKKNDPTGKENGGYYFGQVAQGADYANAVTQKEASILANNPDIAKKLEKYRNHIELGPGLGAANKFKQYIYEQFNKGNKKSRHYKHYGFDVAGSVTAALTNSEYSDDESITGVGVNDDWFKTELFDSIDDKAYYMFGGSIGNFDEDNAVTLLKRLSSNSYRKGSPILLSHFLAPRGDDREAKKSAICQSYKTKEGEQFIMKGFEALGIDTTKLEFEVVYEEGTPDRVKIGAKVMSDIEMAVGPNQPPVTKKAGEYMRAISSRRYTEKQCEELAERAGCSIKQTRSEEGIGVSLLESANKKLTKTQKTIGRTGLSLLVLFSFQQRIHGIMERGRIEANQQRALEESFAGGSGTYNQLQLVLGNNLRQAKKVLDLLKLRYSADLTDEEKKIVEALFYDRSKGHKQYTEVSVYGRGQASYDARIYNPDLLERFVWDMQHTLLAMGISSIPNEEVLQYIDELCNTYNYQGPRLEFEKVEKKLPSYGGYFFSEDQDGKVTYQENALGIVTIDGTQYIAVQGWPGAPYVIQARPENVMGYEMNPQKVIVNIIQRGRVLLLAEKIREFLIQQYGDEYAGIMYTNGQMPVVDFLTDLYVQGYNFDYLLGGDDPFSASHRESAMRSFVLGYVLPELHDILKGDVEGGAGDRMYLDRSKLEGDMREYDSMRQLVDSVTYHLTMCAVPSQSPSSPQLKSRILKELVMDANRQRLSDDYEIRSRLMRQEDMMRELGMRCPKPADRMRKYPQYKAAAGFVCSGDTRLLSPSWGEIYVMQDGSRIWVRELRVMSGHNVWVGKKITRQERQQIFSIYNSGEDMRPWRHSGVRGVSTTERDPARIVTDFISNDHNSSWSADVVAEAYEDYGLILARAKGGPSRRQIPRY